jgi:bifunctional ADP-heptose synthase (sugar kinase/adenylyltransferase)
LKELLPDFLVKWWDYKVEDIVWYKEITKAWWKVLTIPILENYSTTNIIKKILEVYK